MCVIVSNHVKHVNYHYTRLNSVTYLKIHKKNSKTKGAEGAIIVLLYKGNNS